MLQLMFDTYLLIMACNCAFLTVSLDGNPVLSQSSVLSFLHTITNFLRQNSSSSVSFRFVICSSIISKGPTSQTNTLSLGLFSSVSSTPSAARNLSQNHTSAWLELKGLFENLQRDYRVYVLITNPDEFDLADARRHCNTVQADSLI